jgi:hypothetical protein
LLGEEPYLIFERNLLRLRLALDRAAGPRGGSCYPILTRFSEAKSRTGATEWGRGRTLLICYGVWDIGVRHVRNNRGRGMLV